MTTGQIVLVAAGAAAMLLPALLFGLVLGWANVRFRLRQDPRVDEVLAVLPGANCGGCVRWAARTTPRPWWMASWRRMSAPSAGPTSPSAWRPSWASRSSRSWPYRPVIHCAADNDNRLGRSDYRGEPTCFAANVIGGVQGCTYGCLGLADCCTACAFDAIEMVNGLPRIHYAKCTGCGACERACPRHIISMIPFKAERMLVVACSNKDHGRLVRQVCKVGCIGCKSCERLNDLFQVTDNLSRVDYERYDPGMDFRPVLQKCPMAGMIYVGKPTPRDLQAVADQKLPGTVTDRFSTTADKADWRG